MSSSPVFTSQKKFKIACWKYFLPFSWSDKKSVGTIRALSHIISFYVSLDQIVPAIEKCLVIDKGKRLLTRNNTFTRQINFS